MVVPIPAGFKVTGPTKLPAEKYQLAWEPSGLYITWNAARLHIHYAGDKAAESQSTLELPTDVVHLRALSQALERIAEQIEAN